MSDKKITKQKPREYILTRINDLAGWRLGNVQKGTATKVSKQILDEALGFRSLCLFSSLDDKELLRLWDKSNLEYML